MFRANYKSATPRYFPAVFGPNCVANCSATPGKFFEKVLQCSTFRVFHLAIYNMAQRHVAFCERHAALQVRHVALQVRHVALLIFRQ